MRTAIFDIDGTVSDSRHRLHHVKPMESVPKDYPMFHSLCSEDPVIKSMRLLVHALASKGKVVFCTGRPEEYRDQTVEWFDINDMPFDRLYMRATGDKRPAPLVKKQFLDGMIEDGFEPYVAFEDQQNVVDMWRENGITCLQAFHV